MSEIIKAKKKIDLLSYLPNFLKEYDELKESLNAENPEFKLLWEKSAEALSDSFILTAGEQGIKRFEKLIGIYPEPWLDLETRRDIVLARWFLRLPYTYRMLLKQLNDLCKDGFSVSKSFETDYSLTVVTHIRNWVKALEIKRLIIKMVPANMRTEYCNSVLITTEKPSLAHCGAATSGKKTSIYCKAKKFEVWQYSGASVKVQSGAKITQKQTKTHILAAQEV